MAVTPTHVGLTLTPVVIPSTAQIEQWSMWIADAVRQIERWAECNGYDVAALNSQDVDFVVREAVAAKVERPSSATQVEIAIDDGRVTRRYESSTGQITIRDEWWDLLRPVAAASSGAFTIRPSYTPDVGDW